MTAVCERNDRFARAASTDMPLAAMFTIAMLAGLHGTQVQNKRYRRCLTSFWDLLLWPKVRLRRSLHWLWW